MSSKVQSPKSTQARETLDLGLRIGPELEWQSSGLLIRKVRVQAPSGQPILPKVQSPKSKVTFSEADFVPGT